MDEYEEAPMAPSSPKWQWVVGKENNGKSILFSGNGARSFNTRHKLQEAQTLTLAAGPPVAELEQTQAEKEERKKARADALKRHTEIRRAFAWPLHRVPLEKRLASAYIAKGKTRLVLPRSYRAGEGEDTKLVRSDEDLNVVVFHWYEERVEVKGEQGMKGVNFVTKDGVVSRRHEYLGPDPRVAGYEVGLKGEIRIRWWDAFLEDQWVGKERWNLEVECDAEGEWVEKI